MAAQNLDDIIARVNARLSEHLDPAKHRAPTADLKFRSADSTNVKDPSVIQVHRTGDNIWSVSVFGDEFGRVRVKPDEIETRDGDLAKVDLRAERGRQCLRLSIAFEGVVQLKLLEHKALALCPLWIGPKGALVFQKHFWL
eukprot:m.924484 g.924484  ORF g.924484 m.924484 type:complete len:141 (+) comp121069_c0_seq1:126-548(+)